MVLDTQDANMKQMTADGHNHFSKVKFTGESHANSKITWEQVRAMRQLRKQGLKLRELAELFHVHLSVCSLIVRNEAWRE